MAVLTLGSNRDFNQQLTSARAVRGQLS